ncbi:hypothetical protein ACFSYG_05830 [Leeuwenhoekiella polynyae]|uniref:Nitrite reductase/ring-hydroxylating ferredoxin subunit n=1 Tax=Leeuwenhoekiella polynyae TaxID=1550906 RepID=A0A4Q0P2B7_9FLAO|nr:hypothetical protein [Leeuwenhoekiella polynyae]RXG20627.1 hypothetical protein DSM02_2481 [Leeuwenhoekiella polynyae]
MTISSVTKILKRGLLTALFCTLTFSCSSDDNRINNPNVNPISFSINLNTNFPEYSQLQFPGNAIYVANAGIRGVFVINTGSSIRAWEATDPNHVPNACSTMNLNGVEATCSCEDNTYTLYTGQDTSQELSYTLIEYRVSQNENNIIISN